MVVTRGNKMKHKISKRKRSLKDRLKIAGATALAVVSLATPALSQDSNVHLTGDLRAQQEKVTTRYGLKTGPLAINGFETINTGDNSTESAVHYTLTKTIPGTEIPTTGWLRTTSSPDKEQTQLGLDFTIASEDGSKHYVLPAWVTLDENGNPTETDFIALGNQNLGFAGAENVDFNYGLIWMMPEGGPNEASWYVGATGTDLATVVGQSSNGTWRTDIGFNIGDNDLGGLVDAKYDPASDKAQVKVMVAQDPGFVTNTTGAVAAGDIFILDAYPTEVNPYLSRIQDKSNGGASLDIVLGNEAGTQYGSLLAGYKVPFKGGDVGLSVGSDLREGEDSKMTANLHARLLGQKVFLEARAKEGAKPEYFVRVNGLSF